MITLQEIEVFLTIAEQHSFSQAARTLHLSQPTVSHIIQNLEGQLHADLFIRHRRGAHLSDAGAALLPMAREMLASAHRLEENMASLQGEVIGHVQVGCSTASGKYLLPRLIAQFREQFPAVRIDVLVQARTRVFEQLISGQVGFGITSKKQDHSDLEYLPFFHDELVLIVPCNHPWAEFGRITLEDLLDVALILREPASGTCESLFHALLKHGITPDMLTVVMELGNAEAVVMAVEENIGAAILSRLVVERSLARNRVAIVEIEGIDLTRTLHIARSLRYPGTRSQTEFWAFLQANLPVQPTSACRLHPKGVGHLTYF